MRFTSRRTAIYISLDCDLLLASLRFTSRRTTIYITSFCDLTSRVVQLGGIAKYELKNKCVKSKFSECPDFSCSRSNGTLELVTSSFPAASESLRANSQSSPVVQPVEPLSRSFSPVRVQGGKARYHRKNPLSHFRRVLICSCLKCFLPYNKIISRLSFIVFKGISLPPSK